MSYMCKECVCVHDECRYAEGVGAGSLCARMLVASGLCRGVLCVHALHPPRSSRPLEADHSAEAREERA